MSKRYLLAGLGVLVLAVALAIPGLAQPGMGPPAVLADREVWGARA